MFSFQVFVFAVVAAVLLLLSSALIADTVAGFRGFATFDKIRAAAVSLSLLHN